MKINDRVKLKPDADPFEWASGLTRFQLHMLESGARIRAVDEGTEMIIAFDGIPYCLPMDMFVLCPPAKKVSTRKIQQVKKALRDRIKQIEGGRRA